MIDLTGRQVRSWVKNIGKENNLADLTVQAVDNDGSLVVEVTNGDNDIVAMHDTGLDGNDRDDTVGLLVQRVKDAIEQAL